MALLSVTGLKVGKAWTIYDFINSLLSLKRLEIDKPRHHRERQLTMASST